MGVKGEVEGAAVGEGGCGERGVIKEFENIGRSEESWELLAVEKLESFFGRRAREGCANGFGVDPEQVMGDSRVVGLAGRVFD